MYLEKYFTTMKKWGFINAWIRDAHDAELDNKFASLLSFNLACVQRGIQKLPTRRFFFLFLEDGMSSRARRHRVGLEITCQSKTIVE